MSREQSGTGVDRDELVEKLADIEHQQWMYWASNLAEREDIPDSLEERWEKNMYPYETLDESTKEHDRKWAREVVELLESEGLV